MGATGQLGRERLAVIGRLRPEPADTEGPRVRARH
jgi:hypothetical protein